MSTIVMARQPPGKEKQPHKPGTYGFGAKTILFNDDFHTFEEVAKQLVRATRCSFAQGMALANKVHTTGSAVVYSGRLERCEAVAMVLEEIALRVVVEK